MSQKYAAETKTTAKIKPTAIQRRILFNIMLSVQVDKYNLIVSFILRIFPRDTTAIEVFSAAQHLLAFLCHGCFVNA